MKRFKRFFRVTSFGLAGWFAGCAPVAAVPEDTLRIVVMSDLNDAYGSIGYGLPVDSVMRRILEDWRPDLVIAAGDLIAGQRPTLSDANVEAMWEAFDATVAAPLRNAGIPLVATLGNHDASAYPAHARDRDFARGYWRRTGAPAIATDTARHPFMYTARSGNAYIIVWDATNQESSVDPELTGWLADALRAPAARDADHRIVVTHLPLFPVAAGRNRTGEYMLRGDSLASELERLGATLLISGHHHAIYPATRERLRFLHSGALGGGPRPLLGADTAYRAVAVLDLHSDGITGRAFSVSEDGAMVPLDTRSLPGSIGDLVRWDIDPHLPHVTR